MRFGGRVAIVTGGASGIGAAFARRVHAEGAAVMIADLDVERGQALAAELGERAAFRSVDVADAAALETLAADTAAAFGGIDILYNNAGIGCYGLTPDLAIDQWRRVVAVNLDAVFYGCRAVIPYLKARGGGAIVNTASIAGLQAGWGPIAYSSAKAAVIHMTRVAAAQLTPQGIRVNAICPGLIATSIFGASLGLPREVADQMAAQVEQHAASVQPVPKAGVPADIPADIMPPEAVGDDEPLSLGIDTGAKSIEALPVVEGHARPLVKLIANSGENDLA